MVGVGPPRLRGLSTWPVFRAPLMGAPGCPLPRRVQGWSAWWPSFCLPSLPRHSPGFLCTPVRWRPPHSGIWGPRDGLHHRPSHGTCLSPLPLLQLWAFALPPPPLSPSSSSSLLLGPQWLVAVWRCLPPVAPVPRPVHLWSSVSLLMSWPGLLSSGLELSCICPGNVADGQPRPVFIEPVVFGDSGCAVHEGGLKTVLSDSGRAGAAARACVCVCVCLSTWLCGCVCCVCVCLGQGG